MRRRGLSKRQMVVFAVGVNAMAERLLSLEEQFAEMFGWRDRAGWVFGRYAPWTSDPGWWWRCPCHGIQRLGHASFQSVLEDCRLEHDARLSEDLDYD